MYKKISQTQIQLLLDILLAENIKVQTYRDIQKVLTELPQVEVILSEEEKMDLMK